MNRLEAEGYRPSAIRHLAIGGVIGAVGTPFVVIGWLEREPNPLFMDPAMLFVLAGLPLCGLAFWILIAGAVELIAASFGLRPRSWDDLWVVLIFVGVTIPALALAWAVLRSL